MYWDIYGYIGGAKSITDQTIESDVRVWMARIRRAEEYQKKQHDFWNRSRDLATGARFANDPFYMARGGHFTNLATAYIDTHLPAVVFRYPKINIKAKQRHASLDMIRFAQAMSDTENHLWEDQDQKAEDRKSVLDAICYSIGWMKIGFQAQFGTVETEQNQEMSFENLNTALLEQEKDLSRQTKQGKVIEMSEKVQSESVYSCWVSAFDMFVPEGYHYIEDMPYLIQRYVQPIEDIRNNTLFNENREFVQSKKRSFTSSKGVLFQRPQQDSRSVVADFDQDVGEYFEVWDKRGQSRFYLADGLDGYLREPDPWPYWCDGFPYECLTYRDEAFHPECTMFYTTPDLIVFEPQLVNISNMISQMANHRKRFNRKYLVPPGILTETQKELLAEPEDGGIVEISGDPLQVRELKDLPLPTDVYRQYQLELENFRMTSGILQTGFSGIPGVDTATESKIVAQGPMVRVQDRQSKTEDFMRRISRKRVQLIWQFYHPSRIEEILGRPLDFVWPEPSRRRVQQELVYKIEPGSAKPPDDEALEAVNYLKTVSVISAPQFMGQIQDWGIILKQLLDKVGFKEVELAIGDQNKEMQDAQVENEFLAQNLPQAVTGNDQVHMKVHMQSGIQNDAMMLHIQGHAGRLPEGKAEIGPQKGDTSTPRSGASPEIERSGATRMSDLRGAASNIRGGTGTETGMMR